MTQIHDPSTRIAYLAWQFGHTTEQRLEKALRAMDLNLAQFRALVLTALTPGVSSAEIARHSGLTAQSMGAAVNGLIERGLVERSPHPANRRILELRLTEAGRVLTAEAQALVDSVQQELFRVVSADEQESLRELLRRLIEHANPDALRLVAGPGSEPRQG